MKQQNQRGGEAKSGAQQSRGDDQRSQDTFEPVLQGGRNMKSEQTNLGLGDSRHVVDRLAEQGGPIELSVRFAGRDGIALLLVFHVRPSATAGFSGETVCELLGGQAQNAD